MTERKMNTKAGLMGDRSFRITLVVRTSRVEKDITRKQYGIIKWAVVWSIVR